MAMGPEPGLAWVAPSQKLSRLKAVPLCLLQLMRKQRKAEEQQEKVAAAKQWRDKKLDKGRKAAQVSLRAGGSGGCWEGGGLVGYSRQSE